MSPYIPRSGQILMNIRARRSDQGTEEHKIGIKIMGCLLGARKVQSSMGSKIMGALRCGTGTKIFERVTNISVLILTRPAGIDSKEQKISVLFLSSR
jgi:hypothetical protein